MTKQKEYQQKQLSPVQLTNNFWKDRGRFGAILD
jgi:hypothetical protein